jgi:hypothetical protein
MNHSDEELSTLVNNLDSQITPHDKFTTAMGPKTKHCLAEKNDKNEKNGHHHSKKQRVKKEHQKGKREEPSNRRHGKHKRGNSLQEEKKSGLI